VNTLSSDPEPVPQPVPQPDNQKTTPDQNRKSRFLWQGKVLPAFWTIASLFSILVNVVLIVVVLILASELFSIKKLVQVQLVDGLYENFVKMDEAHIVTTIQVSDTIKLHDSIPVVFDLPLKQGTEIMLTKDTPIKKASVVLNGQSVPTDIVLREGTRMSIALDLVVPVNQQVPVELSVPVNLIVPVDIPLANSELHEPFTGLQDVVAPYKKFLDGLPDSWGDLMCMPFKGWLCNP
jgi:hypothetical protein